MRQNFVSLIYRFRLEVLPKFTRFFKVTKNKLSAKIIKIVAKFIIAIVKYPNLASLSLWLQQKVSTARELLRK